MSFDVDRWLRVLGFLAFLFRLIVEALRAAKAYQARKHDQHIPPGPPRG